MLIDGGVHQHAPVTEIYQRPATVGVARLLGGFAEIAGTVRDGMHHSAWGRLPVADGGAEDGAAVLLVRRESLRLVATDSGGVGLGYAARKKKHTVANTAVARETGRLVLVPGHLGVAAHP